MRRKQVWYTLRDGYVVVTDGRKLMDPWTLTELQIDNDQSAESFRKTMDDLWAAYCRETGEKSRRGGS